MTVKVPDWMEEASLEQFTKSAIPGESPRDAFERIARGNQKLFQYLWNGWICPSTPVLANFNTDRGLPISCFSSVADDSLDGIFDTGYELARLTKAGGGTAVDLSNLRERGAPIRGYGTSNGVIPWSKLYDTIIDKVRQGNVRRGSVALYLDVYHPDFEDFLRIRRPEGDPRNQCLDTNIAVKIPDVFMERLKEGHDKERRLWALILKERLEMGEPYIFFSDTANKDVLYPDFPEYKVSASNLCVSGDTLLLTKEYGYIEIEKVAGQVLNVWNGSQWSLSPVTQTGTGKKLLRVTLSDGRSVLATPDHKFYKLDKYHSRDYLEVRATDLKQGDRLMRVVFPVVDVGNDDGLPDPYTAGFFLGDGTSHNNANFVDLYHDKLALEKLIDTDGYKSRSVNEPSRRVRIRVSNLHSKDFVPLNATVDYRLKWFAGYADADGCVTYNNGAQSLQIASIRLEGIRAVQRMLETLGVSSKVVMAKAAGHSVLPDGRGGSKKYQTKEVHRLLVPHSGLSKLKELGIEFKRLVIKDHQVNRSAEHFPRVVSVEEVPGVHDTYCVNEPLEHKVVFNGILTGNCSEIMLHSDVDHTFVCCLSSLNLAKYDEWKDTDVVDVAVELLDDVMEEFIVKASKLPGLEKAVRFAVKSRALGLGVLGFHTLLQKKMLVFGSRESAQLNYQIFKQLREQSYKASERLFRERGAPEWCKSLGRRNTHLLAVAPTFSNSIVSGFVSEGINPIPSNAYLHRSSKKSFLRYNTELEKLGILSEEDWKAVEKAKGSVQGLDIDQHIKDVFKTAKEINQVDLVELAATRQLFIDQGQSFNLYCYYDVPKNVFNQWHLLAYERGLKSLYYVRSSAAAAGDFVNYTSTCSSCEG